MPDIEERLLNLLNKNKKSFYTITYFSGDKQNFVSESVQNVTGFTSSELSKELGGLNSIICEQDRLTVKKTLTELFSSPFNNKELTFRIVTKENKIKNIHQSVFVERNELGKVIIIETINTDFTIETGDSEAINQEYKKLLEMNNAKDKFISIVSHDLRAPFTSLLGFSEILINEKDLPEDEKQEYLGYINNAAQSQLQLVNHLLDWSRLQTGRLVVEPHRLNVKSIVANSTSLLTGTAIRKNVTIYQSIDEELYIHADERLISQAVCNLIGNAIKFTPAGKSITVSAEKFKTGYVEIVIKDEGIGISELDQTKIFKIDEKFSANGTEGEKGSGLGLILVKDIIEKHNGEIWFYSKQEVGTEFHFTIPEAKNVVLIVEDDPSMLSLYKKIITKAFEDCEIIEANNGYEALRVILNKLPSLVITDHEMPLMSGIQLIEAIRKKEGKRAIPIIVISAKFNDTLRQKYTELGVKKLIPKPIEGKQLVDLIYQSVN